LPNPFHYLPVAQHYSCARKQNCLDNGSGQFN
jgi:hypothetical protein